MTTAEYALRTVFFNIYETQPYEQMTVRALCELAPTARTTFYAYYDNIDHLKLSLQEEMLVVLRRLGGRQISSAPVLEEHLKEVTEAIWGYRDINHAFLVAQPDNLFVCKWRDQIKEHITQSVLRKSDHRQSDMAAHIASTAVIETYQYWLANSERTTSVDVRRLVTAILQGVMPILA